MHPPLMVLHPTRREAIVLAHDRLARVSLDTPHQPIAILDEPERIDDGALVMCDALTPDGLIVCGREADAIELRRWDDFSLAARVRLSKTYEAWARMAIDASGEKLVGVDSARRVRLLDLNTRRIDHARLGAGQVDALAISRDGERVAAVRFMPKGGEVRVFSTRGGRLRVHIDALDRRTIKGPTRALEQGCASLCFSPDGEILYLYTSTSRALGAGSWSTGWRGCVEAHDVISGKLWWSAELDAQVTGDLRSTIDLGLDGGMRTRIALCEDGESLALGTHASGVIVLDARDGALRSMKSFGGAQTIAQIVPGAHEQTWILSSRGHILQGEGIFSGA